MSRFIWAIAIVISLLAWCWFSPINWHNPHFLWGGTVVSLVLLWRWIFPRRSSALRFPSIRHLKELRFTWRVYGHRLLPMLKFIGLLLLIIALARPQKGDERTRINSKGIAIMMAIDISGSMGEGFSQGEGGQTKSRLDVVKEVFHDFVAGDGEMPGRKRDLVGIVAFGGYAESRCPLTLDHGALLNILQQIKIPGEEEIVDREELSTAIGDALIAGGKRLYDYQWEKQSDDDGKDKSKVLILLTDGESNTGEDPLWAAGVVRDWGIKIYTIGIGGPVFRKERNLFGELVLRQYNNSSLDEKLLQKIADTGNGLYFNARDRHSLREIYQDINRLERREIKTDYLEFHELYLWFLLPGFALLLLEKLLTLTVLRKVP